MSDDIEQCLRAARRAPPSAGFDRRMEALFAAPPTRAPAGWWRAAILSATGIAAAFALLRLSPKMEIRSALPAPAPILCRIEAHGLMREMLVPSPRAPAPPALEAAVRSDVSP